MDQPETMEVELPHDQASTTAVSESATATTTTATTITVLSIVTTLLEIYFK